MDKNYKMTFKMDTYVQGTLILLILISSLLAFFGSNDFVFLNLLLLFPLGVWQVSSGILFSILLKDKKRLTYLLSVIGFFTSMYIPTLIGIKVNSELAPYFGFSLMAVLAFYYFGITMRDMVAANTEYIRARK